MRHFKKVKILLLTVILSMFMIAMFKNSFIAHAQGIGNIDFEWNREIYDGVNLRHTMSHNRNDEQKAFTITFDPKTTALKPVVTTGQKVMGGNTMSSLVSQYESLGNHVVFGVNGDGYDTSNGIPSGISINDGVLLNSSSDKLGWGITADGEVKYGNAKLPMSFTIEGQNPINFSHVNKERKLDESAIYFLTEDFSDATNSTQAGVEVILNVQTEGGLRIGQPHEMTVEQVYEVGHNTNLNKTPIGEGKAALTTHINSNHYQTLKNLVPGTKITVNVNDNTDSRINWTEIVAGMGVFHLLLDNGVETAELENPDIHPRTAMGIKADGTIILMQNDGRQIGWASGLSFREMVEYMRDELGAVTIFNFDGGGSSTISATLPGDNRATVLNRPSDGKERSNANAFLLIATEEPTVEKEVEKIHIFPSQHGNHATKAMILENGKMSFRVSATDKNYYPVPVNGQVTYRVESDSGRSIGTVSSQGVFTASGGTSSGRVIASMGDKEAAFEIEVVNSITKIETDHTIISVGPGRTIDLEFRAYNDGVPIQLSNEALNFRLEPETLGTIDAAGRYTATDGEGTGDLIVTYKTFEVSIPVEVGKMPYLILDFESDIFSQGWAKAYTNIPGNGGAGNITINNDERFVKHGDGSLRIDYDFATNPLKGTVAIEIFENPMTVLEGQPKAIGAWIYGDGNDTWFRIQLTGGKYAGDTRINWVGWRYIETPIPQDAPFPFTLQRAVRLLGTPTIGNNTKGTVYVDSVRAIYDFKNDDNEPPVLVGDVSPLEGSSTANTLEPIKLTVKDSDIEPITGIKTSRTQMYVNGILVENIQQTVNQDGSVEIFYNPGHLDKLRPGVQNIRVRVEDNFGNKKFIEWSFIVEGYAVTLDVTKPDKNVIYAGEVFEYIIDTASYKNFDEFILELSYNKNNLELLEFSHDDRLNTIRAVDNNGEIDFHVVGLSNHTKTTQEKLFYLKFQAKVDVSGTTGIIVKKSDIVESGKVVPLAIEGFDVNLDYKYVFSLLGATKKGYTTLTVTENQVGVKDVGFYVKVGNDEVEFEELTIEGGKLVTDFFTSYPAGTVFTIYAIKDGVLSNTQTLTIIESLGTNIPQKIAVTVGENSGRSVGISYQTNHNIEDGNIWISTDSELADARVIKVNPTIIYTTDSGVNKEYTSWGGYVKELEPDTVYYYQVGSDAGKSEILSFKTPKESGDMNIAIFGDIQGGYDRFAQVVDKALTREPNVEMILQAGDVSDAGHNYRNWTDLDTHNKVYLSSYVWAAAIGNHDVTDDGLAFANYFYGPDNGIASKVGRRNYYFTIGDAIIYNFDTEAGFAAFDNYDMGFTKQLALMTEVMNNTDKTFKIVLMHRSSYPLNYNEQNIRDLAATFEALDIDLVLSGHDHVYSRTSMRNGVKQELHDGVVYVVTGSAANKFYDGDDTRPWVDVVYDDNNPVYMIMRFKDGHTLEFETYALETKGERLVDSFVISKSVVEIEEGNFTYLGPNAYKVGQTVNFRLQADFGHKITEVKVGSNIITPNENGVYSYQFEIDDLLEVQTEVYSNKYDLNNDGQITKEDALMVLRIITGKDEASSEYLTLHNLTKKDLTMAFAREILEMVGDK